MIFSIAVAEERSGKLLLEHLAAKEKSFRKSVEDIFRLRAKGIDSSDGRYQFAVSTLSSLIGGIGYTYLCAPMYTV
jgi:hypothetical protein